MALDTVRKLVTAQLQEIGYLGQGQRLSDADAQLALSRFQTLVDELRADRILCYTVKRRTFTLTANQQAHTIGITSSGADLIVTGDATRPIWLASASIIPAGQTQEVPLAVLTRKQWLAEVDKAQTSTYPTKVNYEPTFPNGTLRFLPIQTTAPTVVLGIPVPIDTITSLDTSLSFPPGYEALFLYRGARRLCRPFRKPLTTDLVVDDEAAYGKVVRLNDEGPGGLVNDLAARGIYDGYSDEFV